MRFCPYCGTHMKEFVWKGNLTFSCPLCNYGIVIHNSAPKSFKYAIVKQ